MLRRVEKCKLHSHNNTDMQLTYSNKLHQVKTEYWQTIKVHLTYISETNRQTHQE